MQVSSDNSEDADLNIVPIIDCFTVLITYLLAAASFLNLTVFDVGVAIQGESVAISELPKDPPVAMTLQIEKTNQVVLKITGGKQNLNRTMIVEAAAGKLDIKSLGEKLLSVKDKYPNLTEPNVTAHVAVLYKQIVQVVELTKKTFPKVYLAGNYEEQVR